MRLICLVALSASLLACSDFHKNFPGYPTQDTVINLETATSNEIADALSQLSHIAVIGDDWEFFDPDDACTVHVIDQSKAHTATIHLQGAQFAMRRDAVTKSYYATMQHAGVPVLNADQAPMRLFETDAYHDVFFAEGYLLALTRNCHQSLHRLQAQAQATD